MVDVQARAEFPLNSDWSNVVAAISIAVQIKLCRGSFSFRVRMKSSPLMPHGSENAVFWKTVPASKNNLPPKHS